MIYLRMSAKIASTSQVTVSTLDGGDPNGKVELGGGVNISGGSYDSVSFSLSSQGTNPEGGCFNSNGTKFFICNGSVGADAIYQYSVTTPFTLIGASYDSVSLSTQSQTNSSIRDIFLGDNGTKLYAITNNGNTVYQYTLPNANTLTSASYASKSFSVNSQDSFAWGLTFNESGTKMYILGGVANDIFQYTLSTAWDVSTASYDSSSYAFSFANIKGITFTNSGDKLVAMSISTNLAYQYSLSTPYDLSTITYDSITLNTGSQDTSTRSFFIGGSKLIMVGGSNDSVFQYSVSNSFFTSGNFVTTSIDLTSDLSEAPNQVVVSSEFATPTDTTLSVTISDGTNTVTIPSANFDTEVDCSALTSRTLTATWNFATTDTANTPTLTNYGIYFT
jgi:hypothetical protein